jgi:hypothetical protein
MPPSGPRRLDLCQPDDHVAVALSRPAHGPEPVGRGVIEINHALALLVRLALEGHSTKRQRGHV